MVIDNDLNDLIMVKHEGVREFPVHQGIGCVCSGAHDSV